MRQTLLFLGVTFLFIGCDKDEIFHVTDPVFYTSDISLFWSVFDSTITNYSAAEFNDLYISQGTDGLRDYAGQKSLASSLQSTLRSGPYLSYYNAIRSNTLDMTTVIEKSDDAFARLQSIYSDTRLYNVYFLIGALTAGGRVSKNGLLIAVEMFTKNEDTQLDNLSTWHQNVIRNKEYLPSIVLHELVHKQQTFSRKNDGYTSLLEQSIKEGMADFVSHYILSDEPFVNAHLHDYGNAIEKELWLEFQPKIDRNYEGTEWLYSGQPTSKGHPADMGYYMGYKILEAYVSNFASTEEAIQAMLSTRDYYDIFLMSRYETKFD